MRKYDKFEEKEDYMTDKVEKKGWLRSYGETLGIIIAIVTAAWTIKSDIHSLDIRLTNQMNAMDLRLTNQIHELDKRLISMEMVMILQGYPIRAMAMNTEEDISR